jgi:PAS domain S-box-containing protein
MEVILGLRREQVIGTRMYDFLPDAERARLRGTVDRRQKGLLEKSRYTLTQPDGSPVHAVIETYPVYDRESRYIGAVATVSDETEKEKALQSLRVSEARMRAIFEGSTIGLAFGDMNGGFVECNAAFAQILGYTTQELRGMAVPDVTHPDDLKEDHRLFSEVLAGSRRSYAIDKRFVHKDGHIIWGHVEVSLVRDEEGTPLFPIAIVQDVTERQHALESLKESELRYRSLFAGMMNGVAYCCMIYENGLPVDFVYLVVNAAFGALTGLHDVVGKRVTEVIPGIAATNQELLAMYGRVATTGQPETAEVFVPLLNMWFTISAYSLDKDHFVAVFDVITERKLAEEKLKNSLEQMRMLEARLERSREEERRTISREVHDELGQVLTALRLDLMKMKKHATPGDAASEATIESALALNDSAIRSVQDISARLRPGLLDDIGLVAAIEWQTEEFQKRTGIACELDLPKHDPAIDADRSTTVFRILQETLTNVARHAKAQSVAVSFAEREGALTLIITDDGIGIPDGKANAPTSFGLLGIRERLRPHGGQLTLTPGPRGGTVVHVTLPGKAGSVA